MLKPKIAIRPPEFDDLVQSIAQALKEPGASALHQNVIKRCLGYLKQHEDHHWFCDPFIAPIASHILILFSFPNTSHTSLIKPTMTKCLLGCPECVRGFGNAKYALYTTFVIDRKIDPEKVEMVLHGITLWEKTLVEDDIDRFSKSVGPASPQFSAEDRAKLQTALHIVMENADLLRMDQLKQKVVHILKHTAQSVPLLSENWNSGLMFLYMTMPEQEVVRLVPERQSKTISAHHADDLTIKEFSRYLRDFPQISKTQGPAYEYFWNMCFKTLVNVEPAHFKNVYNCPRDFEALGYPPGFKEILDTVLQRATADHLPVVLGFLDRLLCTLKELTWEIWAPMPYKRLLDVIFGNKFFTLLLSQKKRPESLSCSQWMLSIGNTLSDTNKATAAFKIASFILKVINGLPDGRAEEDQELTGHMLMLAMKPVIQCLRVMEDMDVKSPTFEVEILARRDVRAVVDDYSPIIQSRFQHASGEELQLLMELMELAIGFDLHIFAFNSSALQRKVLPKVFDIYPLLWSTLSTINFSQNDELCRCLFRSLSKTSGITDFIPKKREIDDRKLARAIEEHNEKLKVIITKINLLLEKTGMLDPVDLLRILEDPATTEGFWGGVFAHDVSQNVLNVLYQAFDTEGRYEGILEFLRRHLKSSLKGIVVAVRAQTTLQAFEPCPRTVRVLMDIISALNKDIISTESENEDVKHELKALWETCWNFLVMLYKNTLQWANLYHSDQLVEFTRDTLDLSHSLMDSYGLLTTFINDPKASLTFAQQVLDVFDSIIVWLRLGDPSLLSSCVSLVFKGIASAEENNLVVKDETLMSLVKYAVKAKKYNNKLTQQQRSSLLSKIREMDAVLVDYTLADLAPSKSASATASPAAASPTISAVTKPKTDPSAMKQMKLTSFGSFSKSSSPIVAPEPPVVEKKLTGLDLIRSQLKTQRVVTHNNKPISAPAPPRPAGFNPKLKPVAVGRSLNALKKKNKSDSSDDDMDEDGGVDTSDLFIDKKKPKVVAIDIHGRPLKKAIGGNRVVDKQQLEQQRMQFRLNVDLKSLYQKILKWNFGSVSYPSTDFIPKERGKDSFDDVKEYTKSVEPLLMLECWAGIQSAKERGDEKPFDVFLGTRLSCDGFFDLICTIKRTDIADRKLTDTDLIVLAASPGDDMPPYQMAANMKNPGALTCLAKIKQIKYYNQEVSDVTIRVAPSGPMLGLLGPKTSLVGMKVMQMVTIEREYSSLKGLEYYDLSNEIIKAIPAQPSDLSEAQLSEAMRTYKVNKSQANAIVGTQKATGFSLIQGPPGTGKTKTILGIVGYNLKEDVDPNAVLDTRTVDKNSFKDDKILICAPSNAAVDELVLRLKDGVINSSGKLISPRVVRLGRSDAVNAAVKDCTLEELVDAQLTVKQSSTDPQLGQALRQEHTKLTNERKELFEKKRDPNISEEESRKYDTMIRDITKRRNQVSQQLDAEREKNTIAQRTKEIDRKRIQESILNNAQVICSTLSGSAHDFVASLSMTFNKVIIDEACQCVELSAIIPLRYGCHQCIMVGDPNQLPPTVLSQAATKLNYDQSLFVRMQKANPDAVYLLDVQYRMHPSISKFPSANFYNGRLKDGEGMAEKNTRPWHQLGPLSPYRFFNVTSSHGTNDRSKSLYNSAEANMVLELVEQMMNIMPEKDFKGSIGVISPYKEQIRTLKSTFARKFGDIIFNEIDFNTVDGFQGQEKDIIIMSCVRSSPNGGVGFLSDIRRMNVALTRAKSTLWILGNADSLSRDDNWKRLIEDARSRNGFMDASPGFLRRALTAPPSMHNTKPAEDKIQMVQEHVSTPIPENPTAVTATKPISGTNKSAVSSSNKLADATTKPASIPVRPPTGPSALSKHHDGPQPKKSSIFDDNASKRPNPDIPDAQKKQKMDQELPQRPKGPSQQPSRTGLLQKPKKSSIFINRRRK